MTEMSEYDIRTKRIYEPAAPDDGVRCLVDGIWPRGIRKDEAKLDHWLRGLAPSKALRQWYGHDPARWETFRERYLDELRARRPEDLETLRHCLRQSDTLTLLFASRETRLNNAVALKAFIEHGEI